MSRITNCPGVSTATRSRWWSTSKLQKLLLDGRTPDGLVPFYTCQYIKLEWNPSNNTLRATYEAEYKYLQTVGLTFE